MILIWTFVLLGRAGLSCLLFIDFSNVTFMFVFAAIPNISSLSHSRLASVSFLIVRCSKLNIELNLLKSLCMALSR